MVVEAWLARAAAAVPDVVALEGPAGACSYAELHARACAGALELARRGAVPGSRVAIALPPGLDFAVALHACLLLGAAAVPVDLRLGAAERAAIEHGATVVVGEPLGGADAAESLGGANVAGLPGGANAAQSLGGADTAGRLLAAGAAGSPAVHDLDAVAVVIHTSGTTSAPRPVELTYGNILWSALGSAVALGLDPAERWLCALPLSHVGGLSILLRSAIYGTTAVVHPRFETDTVLRALHQQCVTLVSLVATTLARLLDAGLREPPFLRCALTGGGPVPGALLDRAHAAGVPVSLTYGLTETCSQVTTTPVAALGGPGSRTRNAGPPSSLNAGPPLTPDAGPSPSLNAGPPLFCTRLRIAADGEIEVAGPTVARAALGPDGWLHTGDLGRLSVEGCLEVTGRKADTIVSGGENVAPAEVEAVLEGHPAVLEAAVLGRPDERWGEAVTALVVVRAGAALDEQQLRAHCAARLAPYKVPKHIALVAGPLPRTRSGKLLRRELR